MLEDKLQVAIDLYNNGDYHKALNTLLLCDYDEDDFMFYYYIGLCYIKIEDYEQGRENLSFYLEKDDNLLRIFQCRMLLAYVLIQIGDYSEAQENLEKLLADGYESAKLYSLLGYIYYRKKLLNKSIKCYRKALAIDPENSNALNSLGFILSDFKSDLKEAETLCRKALAIDVNNPAYLDSLGVVCLKNNKIPASVSFLKRAETLAPQNTEIKDHIKQLERLRSSL